jgi:hypothetical protein
MSFAPDPEVLAHLAVRDAQRRMLEMTAPALEALRARRAHLDILILLMEAERAMSARAEQSGA